MSDGEEFALMIAAQMTRRAVLAGTSALSMSIANAEEGSLPQATAVSAPHAAGPETFVLGLALQAATYALPIVAMYNLRHTTSFGSHPKVPANEIWRVEDVANPTIAEQAGYVTPNVNVIYGFGFMDLGLEPIIVIAPDSRSRYYMIEICDMWTNAFAYIGGIATGYEGGIFALVQSDWRGELPHGVKRIDCPTRWVEIQPRVHVKNKADLPGAQSVLRAIKVQGLSRYNGKPAPAPISYNYVIPRINPKVASSQMQFLDPLQFWEIFAGAMNENPPPESEIEAVLPQFKYLGIELGKPWQRDGVNPTVLEQMKLAAAKIGLMMTPLLPILGNQANGWIIPPANVGKPGADFPGRAIVAAFGLTSNTPMEAIYYSGFADGYGEPLVGAKRYKMTFNEPMDYIKSIPPGFWSISVYDAVTGYTVPNSINRYSLGSNDLLKRGDDNSFTLFLQHDNPSSEQEGNWLPTPVGPFYLILRNYAPVPEIVAALKDPANFRGPPPVIPTG
jgi:hypothetical protein